MPPVVSICLPTLNARRFLEPRMESILAQTLTDWELIVCDSHSDDGTWEYFQQFKNDPRVGLHQVPREGLYAGWNECLRRVTGEYVYIATADDTCTPDCLEKMVGALECVSCQSPVPLGSNEAGSIASRQLSVAELNSIPIRSFGRNGQAATGPDSSTTNNRPIDIAICRYHRIDAHGNVAPRPESDVDRFYANYSFHPHIRNGHAEFLVNSCIGCDWDTVTAMIFRRRLLNSTGPFDVDFGVHADGAWRLRAVLNSDLVFLPDKLATWRMHASQATAKRPLCWAREHFRCTRETLKEIRGMMPEMWRKDPDCVDKLLCHALNVYLQSYHLNRADLQKSPLSFASGVAWALVREPAYLIRRLGSGISWGDRSPADDTQYLRQLLSDWNVEWLPRTIALMWSPDRVDTASRSDMDGRPR